MSGSVVQAAIALLTVPAYLSTVGEERFGIYVLAFLLVGYFGLFERGFGAAVQLEIAQLGSDAAEARSIAVWTAVVLNALFGLLAGAALLGVAWFLFADILSIPADLRAESLDALPLFAVCVPIQMTLAVFQSSLAGRERFASVSVLDTVRMSLLQVLPLAFAYWWGPELVWLAAGCLAALVVSMVLFVAASLGLALPPKLWGTPSRTLAVRFFHYAKWVTVTGVISGLLEISDRFVLGALRGATAVTTFAVPYGLTSRLLVVPYSLVRVAFPRFSAIGPEDARALGASGLIGLAAVTAPIAVLGATLAGPFLDVWIGGELATNAAPVAAVLFIGVWISGLGYIPHALLWAGGRPELPARLHAFELIPFLLVLAVGVEIGGAFGAAVAWACRAVFDSALLVVLARLPSLRDWRLLATGAIVTVAGLNAAVPSRDTYALLVVGAVLTMLSLIAAWVLSPAAFRARVTRVVRRRQPEGERRDASDLADPYA